MRAGVALAVASVLAAAVYAAAASLDVDPGTVAAGGGVIEACDTDGVGVDYTVEFNPAGGRFEVTHVTVTHISAACNGTAVQVVLLGGGLLGSAASEAHGGTTGAMEVDTPPAADEVEDAHVAISN
jgi:hypothetical protein